LLSTDHNEIRGALEALKFSSSDFRVIPGVEVSSVAGHILALGVEEVVARGLPADETVDQIHALGGVAVAAHPFDRLRQGVGGLVYTVGFDAVEVYNGHTILSYGSPEEIIKRLKVPAVGGSDAHLLCEIGSVVMELDGDPLDSLIKGRGRVSVNISKAGIVYNHIKRKLAKRKV